MPTSQLPIAGVMNLDDNNEVFPKGHYKSLRNGRLRGNQGNYRVEVDRGTKVIPNSFLPAGANECVGSYYDQLRQRIVWMNWNSNGSNGMYIYNTVPKTIQKLLISFNDSAEQLFNFDPKFPISSINILYRTEQEGDIIHWTGRNDRPMKLNIKDALDGFYGSTWKKSFLTVNRNAPMAPAIASYFDDSTRKVNNTNRKVFEFRYRWVYKDLTKSIWSPYSKIPAPFNPDDIAIFTDPTKNNGINVVVKTGDFDATDIEIGFREQVISSWTDDLLAVVLNKEELAIGSNADYIFKFYNDSSYQITDKDESLLLFSNVPQLANCQELLNGNVVIYGGITQGYDLGETLDVTSNVTIIPNTQNIPLACSDSIIGLSAVFNISGTPVAGDFIDADCSGRNEHEPPESFGTTGFYTVLAGNTLFDVATALSNSLFANRGPSSGWTISVSGPNIDGSYDIHVTRGAFAGQMLSSNCSVTLINPTAPTEIGTAVWRPRSRHAFGLVYFDEFGENNGTNVQQSSMFVESGEVTTTGQTQSSITSFNFSVNHKPPIWAKTYAWVRSANLTVTDNIYMVSNDIKLDPSDAAGKEFVYIDITKTQTNQVNLPVYDFKDGDRLRIVFNDYGLAFTHVVDSPIVTLVQNPTINAVTVTGFFIKLRYTAASMSFGTGKFFWMEAYTPAPNIAQSQLTFYEFGEMYNVLNPGTPSRAHQGQAQDQIPGTQPAVFHFTRGDFYLRNRVEKIDTTVPSFFVFDQSVSDFFPSKINSNARPSVIDKFARNTYFPTKVAFGGFYQQNTSVNNTNLFYPNNFDEFDRQKGDIQRLKSRGRVLRVFQERACGEKGVYANYIQDSEGTNTLVTTDAILTPNNINYYAGEAGIGKQHTGLASDTMADYFCDPILGIQFRLSGNGLTPISDHYKAQFYLKPIINSYLNGTQLRTGAQSYKKIFGFFDNLENEFVTIFQGQDTITFNEKKNAYTGFFDIQPEWAICAENTNYYWTNGVLNSHDNTIAYANYFGVQKAMALRLIMNDGANAKKDFGSIGYHAPFGHIFSSPSTGNVNTALGQVSNLKDKDFDYREGMYSAAFWRDVNSPKGLINGDFLKGVWIDITLKHESSDFFYIFGAYMNYNLSQKTY